MPDIELDKDYQPRLWRCEECRRVLGVVMRDAGRVRRLYVFHKDRDEKDVPTTFTLFNAPRGLFRVWGCDAAGRPGGIECSICGAITDWKPSQESYERLMSHYA